MGSISPDFPRFPALTWAATDAVSSPQRVERTAARSARANEAYGLLSVQLRGRSIVSQGEAQANLTPGSMAFYDTTRPCTLTLPCDFDQIVWHLPHAARRLAAPLLTPHTVASAIGVSLRRLQEAFQQHRSTVAECIWEMRLELARSMLTATGATPINDVALHAGFADAAHFSRRFRQRYGLSPRDYRLAVRQT